MTGAARPSGLQAARASPAATALRAAWTPETSAPPGQQPSQARPKGLPRPRTAPQPPLAAYREHGRVIYRHCCNDPLSPRRRMGGQEARVGIPRSSVRRSRSSGAVRTLQSTVRIPASARGASRATAPSTPLTGKQRSTPSCWKPSKRSPASSAATTIPATAQPDLPPPADTITAGLAEHAHRTLPNDAQTTWPLTALTSEYAVRGSVPGRRPLCVHAPQGPGP